jgi:hypothetical protein
VPYGICRACALVTYSAALWASTDECPRCGAGLHHGRRTELRLVSRQDHIAGQTVSSERPSSGRSGGEHA